MRDDFCIFILTHGRPDRVITYRLLQGSGYTGKVYLVVDTDDHTLDAYKARYGDQVLTFSKSEAAAYTDPGDNSGDMRTPLYARNACFRLAEQVGCATFLQLDDDYTSLEYRYDQHGDHSVAQVRRSLDGLIEALLTFYLAIPAISIAMSQGGDWMGDSAGHSNSLTRKAMNSFFCTTARPFLFRGRLNDDVSTYVEASRRGDIFFTVTAVKLDQLGTQSNPGGLTEAYLDSGTYMKSFFSVLYAPSCVRIGILRNHRTQNERIHHIINWHRCAPKILRQTHRKLPDGTRA